MDDLPAEQTKRPWIDLLRWLCVLPAGYIAGWLFGGVLVFFLSLFSIESRGGPMPAFLLPLLRYIPNGIAVPFVGALVAPGRRTATAAILAAICILLSLTTHVLLPLNPGLTNSMHATGESLGAVIGFAATYRRRTRTARATA